MGQRVMITGGAGFIGSNLTMHLADAGYECVVFDNLSRPGVGANVEWLRAAGKPISVVQGDIRTPGAVDAAMDAVGAVYHLAGQTAVTTSVTDPREDFEVNLLGTLNVLEAARRLAKPPRIVFASTNKVYGSLPGVQIIERVGRYAFEGISGVSERQPLEFATPYGCSKGAADQYVLDYGRVYGMQTAVLRMSCIYGPRQFGTEDQGWVAHFVISALFGRQLRIYGDGKQVRDVLNVGDLVRLYAAFLTADSPAVWGQAYNVGGGPANTLSLLELIALLEQLLGRRVPVSFDRWRPSDQRIYVSDIHRVGSAMDWTPRIAPQEGVRRLLEWVQAHQGQLATIATAG